LHNNTAGVREREDVNRTRLAGSRDEVEGVVARTLSLYRNGAVGFIEWLGLSYADGPQERSQIIQTALLDEAAAV
jgi:hypothetical protein